MLRIAADENIPYAQEAFTDFGEVRSIRGREVTAAELQDIDALIIRSTCTVNAELLEGTPVRFVGSATAGTDHIDKPYLRKQGITFADAAGCNAVSVAEYVVLGLHHLSRKLDFELEGKLIGIVGYGNVGRALFDRAGALGMRPVVCDPPLGRNSIEPIYRATYEILACDVVTLHVPLTEEGMDATRNLIGVDEFKAMRRHAILFNTSRGGVVDEAALRDTLDAKLLAAAVLDTWEGEPTINPETLDRAAIASTHIAGYSLDAKVRGTAMMVRALEAFTGESVDWNETSVLDNNPEHAPVKIDSMERALDLCREKIYDPLTDDAALRATMALPIGDRAGAFDAYRRNYPHRREFSSLRVSCTEPELAERLRRLGLQVV